MRSLVVRISPLVLLLIVAVSFASRDRTGADPPQAPPTRASVSSRPKPRVTSTALPDVSDPDPVAEIERAYVSRIESLDRETDGAFSRALARSLSDPDRSADLGAFRLPAREGIDDVLATMPDGDATDIEDVQDDMLLIFMAAAIQSGTTEADRIRNVGTLAERYGLLRPRQ